MIRHRITGAGGVNLAVHEAGNPTGPPILFLHGMSSSHLAWSRMFHGSLAKEHRLLFLDARGHGDSDKPLQANAYTRPELWADDIKAVIDALALNRVTMVAWSYGGFMLNDYLASYGESALGALAYVSAGVLLGVEKSADAFGQAFISAVPGLCSDHLAISLDTIVPFIQAMTAADFPADDLARWVGFHMNVPWQVRVGLVSRAIDQDEAMRSTVLPALVIQGDRDRLIHLKHAHHIAAQLKNSRFVLYENVGHAPPLESPSRLERDIAALVRLAS